VLTHPIWDQIRQHRDLFDGAAAWSTERFDISERGQSDLVDGIFVSGGFFETLGVPPLIGRSISVADDRPRGVPSRLRRDSPPRSLRFEIPVSIQLRSRYVERTITPVNSVPPR
jgi:hypothetical protein